MSIPFSSTTNKNGIIQLIERNLGFSDGTITGDATLLAEFTGDVNLAMDKVISMIFEVGGTWQFDDSNQTDYPIISTNLVQGQRDYSFTTDGSGNLILEIYKVFIAQQNGLFQEIFPVDVEGRGASPSYTSGQNTQGTPITYDKLANGIFLDPVSSYNSTGGLKVYISREGTYFATTDTTKKAGFAGHFHEYLALRPAFQYAYRKTLPVTAKLETEMLKMEQAIMEYYKSRTKDEQKFIRPVRHLTR